MVFDQHFSCKYFMKIAFVREIYHQGFLAHIIMNWLNTLVGFLDFQTLLLCYSYRSAHYKSQRKQHEGQHIIKIFNSCTN